MEIILTYSIYLIFLLIGLSGLALVGFGLRNVVAGKVNVFTAVVVAVPLALAVGLGLATGDWVYGSVVACLITLAITMVTLLLLGVRGLFGA